MYDIVYNAELILHYIIVQKQFTITHFVNVQ